MIARALAVAAWCGAAGALGGCVTVEGDTPRAVGSATLVRGDGSPAGTARLFAHGSGLTLRVEAFGLTPGLHGLHLHAVGRCAPPDFASAGPHWNPANRQHGSANPAGPHAGDIPNLTVGPDGRATLQIRLDDQAAAAGLAGVFDADGTAVVIHAAADDLRTDPSGNSGPRQACGELVRG